MPSGRPNQRALDVFFRSLRADVVRAWVSKRGLAYDRVQYAVAYPYGAGDIDRILRWAGCGAEAKRLPPLRALNDELTSHSYPALATRAPPGVSAKAWSAVLHFCDPCYPLATPEAEEGLRALGFNVGAAGSAVNYAKYLAAVDELKDRAPMWAVPETNWYLARVLEVGLAARAASTLDPA